MGDVIPLGNYLTDTTEELVMDPLHASIPHSIVKAQGTDTALPVSPPTMQWINVVIAGCL